MVVAGPLIGNSLYDLMRQLRVNHKIFIEIRYNMQGTNYFFVIIKRIGGYTLYPQKDPEYTKSSGFKTYEEALDHGIKQSLKFIK